MASTAKTTALTFLIIGLVLGGLGMFLPVGENWVETETIRDAEVFKLFSYRHEVTSLEDDAVVREDGPFGWNHESLNDADGSTLLMVSGVVVIVGLLLSVVAVILTAVPRTLRFGGGLGIFGAAALGTTVLLAAVGMRMRTDMILGTPGAVEAQVGIYLLAVGFLSVLLGSVIAFSMPRTMGEPVAPVWEEHPIHATTSHPTAGRALRCPDCSTPVKAAPGVVPTCNACGFHSRRTSAPDLFSGSDLAWSTA